MRLALTIEEVRLEVAAARRRGLVIGLVPTMGALHEGHGALLRRARAETGFVVVTVFVNPIQFNRSDDFALYPRTLETDLAFCERLGADVVFAPDAGEMYPAPQLTFVEVGELGEGLCGAYRPGHFRGVATVVAKLFNIVQADRAYFGEKDAQQLAILTRMAADLNFACEVVPVATVREPDGLAMSSRNARLSPEERRVAPAIYESLRAAAAVVAAGGGPERAKQAAMAVLANQFRVEYFELVDPASLKPVERITGPVLAITAVWLGEVRLIDNVLCLEARTAVR
jgi:pantoate--beta-alanine ligase